MNFLQEYLDYTKDTESPTVFHRWSAITGIGALLRKNVWVQHGAGEIFPNLYTMLVGDPGARKSSAIKGMKKLMIAGGYTTIAADKTTKEKFLIDLEEQQNPGAKDKDGKPITDEAELVHWLDTELGSKGHEDGRAALQPACLLVAADEFNDFTGNGNIEFYSTLGVLWDYSGTYTSRVKHGSSVSVTEPCISILAGNTTTNISLAFPQEALGQGFLSRLLFVYGETNGRRITWPTVPPADHTAAIIKQIKEIQNLAGCVSFTPEAIEAVDLLYQRWTDLPDARFRGYSTRRLTQFFKVATILCAARGGRTIGLQEVVEANTFLSAIELRMPQALGEYGKSKNSDVAQKVIKILTDSKTPMTARQLWKEVHNDLERLRDLAELLQNLKEADRVQQTELGFLPKIAPVVDSVGAKNHIALVDWKLLTPEEREFYGIYI